MANPKHQSTRGAATDGFARLQSVCRRLTFRPHRIAHLLDAQGQHRLELPVAFPLGISLFDFRERTTTQGLTWHERLELLMPLDGPMRERMGDLVVDLAAGDLLVVDHLKPHQVVDEPGLKTRVVVITMMPECVFAPGSPPTDYAFLLPFFRKVEGRPQVLRAASSRAVEAHEALAHLLEAYFKGRSLHREAGCKAWLLVLLHVLIRELRASAIERIELVRRQEQVNRLKPLFLHVRQHDTGRIALGTAAALCGMSKAVFGRVFKRASGMTLGSYLNHVRMSRALQLLEETSDSIAEISLRLGFSDQSHFSRHFHRTFGRSPGQHRARLARPG